MKQAAVAAGDSLAEEAVPGPSLTASTALEHSSGAESPAAVGGDIEMGSTNSKVSLVSFALRCCLRLCYCIPATES